MIKDDFMFSLYYKRFAKIAASDLNLLPSSSKYSKQVLAYMYATMSERMRKIKISQNLTLEEMTFAILTSSHFLNPENIKNFFLFPKSNPNCSSWSYLSKLSEKCSSPFGEYALKLIYPCFCQKIEAVSEKTLINLFDYGLLHEILHRLLNAPFNQYGEVFVVKTSLILELDPICQWSDFDKVIDNSKFIPIEWKKQKEVYASQLISPYSKELKVLLNEFFQAAKNKSKQFSIEEIQKNSLSKILSIQKFKENYSEKP